VGTESSRKEQMQSKEKRNKAGKKKGTAWSAEGGVPHTLVLWQTGLENQKAKRLVTAINRGLNTQKRGEKPNTVDEKTRKPKDKGNKKKRRTNTARRIRTRRAEGEVVKEEERPREKKMTLPDEGKKTRCNSMGRVV